MPGICHEVCAKVTAVAMLPGAAMDSGKKRCSFRVEVRPPHPPRPLPRQRVAHALRRPDPPCAARRSRANWASQTACCSAGATRRLARGRSHVRCTSCRPPAKSACGWA
eukprot:2845527-Rhodomonas_salina.1